MDLSGLVGSDFKSSISLDLYDAHDGKKILTVPEGTELGVCDGQFDGTTLFIFGSYWLSFPASPLTDGVPFWCIYSGKEVVGADGTPPNDGTGMTATTKGGIVGTVIDKATTLFGGFEIYVKWGLAAVAVAVGYYLYCKFFKKK